MRGGGDPLRVRVRSLSERLFQGNLLNDSLQDKYSIVPMLDGDLCYRQHLFEVPVSALFSISLTSDTCKVEELCKRVEDRLNKHAQNQGRTGILRY